MAGASTRFIEWYRVGGQNDVCNVYSNGLLISLYFGHGLVDEAV